jgi:hypothetical protein
MQIEFRPKSRVKPESTYLLRYARVVTAQEGEDGIIEKIFEIISPANKYCVEIGAYDGKLLSNTWNLIIHHHWRGALIEGREMLFQQLSDRFSARNPEVEGRYSENVTLIHEYAAFEGNKSLDGLLAKAGAPKDLDFISIDIDSNDWYLWESMNVYQPRVVMIEFNATIPNDVYFVQSRDFNINQGCSLLALIELGRKKGYELVATTTANAFFVRKKLFPAFNIADNDIDSMYYNANLQTRLFQGYDGELILAGYQKLHWHDFPFSQEDIQVLPKSLRKHGMVFTDGLADARAQMRKSES